MNGVRSHELKALDGARQTLRHHQPTLFLEAKRETAEAVQSMLSALRYKIRRFDSAGCVDTGPLMVPGSDLLANFLCEPRNI